MDNWYWILSWFLSLLNITGNRFIIFLVCSRRNLRTKTNAFIVPLVMADFCVGLSDITNTCISTSVNQTSKPSSNKRTYITQLSNSRPKYLTLRWIPGFRFLARVLSFLAIIGNGFTIPLVCSSRNLRTKTNAFIVSLAVADLFTEGSVDRSIGRYCGR